MGLFPTEPRALSLYDAPVQVLVPAVQWERCTPWYTQGVVVGYIPGWDTSLPWWVGRHIDQGTLSCGIPAFLHPVVYPASLPSWVYTPPPYRPGCNTRSPQPGGIPASPTLVVYPPPYPFHCWASFHTSLIINL